jgi:hypothetical protein
LFKHGSISTIKIVLNSNTLLMVALLMTILLSGIPASSALAAAPPTGVVVEGVSVPGIELGFTRAQVEAAYGAPAFCQNVNGLDQGACQFDVEGGGQVYISYRGPDGGSATNSPDDVAKYIRWYQQVSGWITTAGVNTTLAYDDPDAVMAAYPDATIHNQSLFDWSLDDPVLGIHVYYHTDYLSGALSVSMAISFPNLAPPEQHFVHVTGIDLSAAKRNLTAAVHVQDDLNRDAYSALVSITWTFPDGSQLSVNQRTDKSGEARFYLYKVRHGTYTITVDDVLFNDYQLDTANSQLSASLYVK